MTFLRRAVCPPAVLLMLCAASCTLHYGEQVRTEDRIPELTFSDVSVTRYEKALPSMQIQAGQLEQYKNRSLYARNAAFSIWGDDGSVQTQGSCTLLGIDTANEVYTMFNTIRIQSMDPDMELYAENLRWNARTEQLTAGANDRVRIRQKDAAVEGTGFSASGISRIFSFTGAISGTVTQDDTEAQP